MNTEEAIKLNDKRWNELILEKYIKRTDYANMVKILDSRRKKDVKILTKALQDLNKTIKKLRKQDIFLNELLDEREQEIRNLKEGGNE